MILPHTRLDAATPAVLAPLRTHAPIRLRMPALISAALLACLTAASSPAQILTQTNPSTAIHIVPTSTRVAGTGAPSFSADSAPAHNAPLNQPSHLVFDSAGNLFLSDTANNCVRRIDHVTGNISTIAGLVRASQSDTCDPTSNPSPTSAEGLLHPSGLAIDALNNLYIADTGHNCVRRLSANASGASLLSTVAGTCTGSATLSSTPQPGALALDPANTLYISVNDTETPPAASTYQVLAHSGNAAPDALCTLAGNPSPLVPNACPGADRSITLTQPGALALDFNGDLYVADTGNNCIRQLHRDSAAATTPIGRCTNDATGSLHTPLISPYGLAFARDGSLLITEQNNVVAFRASTGTLTPLAGLPSGLAGSYQPGVNGKSALGSALHAPRGLAVDPYGNLLVADTGNNLIRTLSLNTFFPATPVNTSSPTQALTFAIDQPVTLSASAGSDFILTGGNCNGPLTPAAGAPPATCELLLQFTPTRPGLRRTPLVLTLTQAKSTSTLTLGLEGLGTGPLGLFSPGTVSTLASSSASPIAIAVDATGIPYLLEQASATSPADLRPLAPNAGRTASPIRLSGLTSPVAFASDAAGNWFVADSTLGTVTRFSADGSIDPTFLTGLTAPSALTVDSFGNLYIAQQGSTHNVVEAYRAGGIRVVTGSGLNLAPDNIPASDAQLISPAALALDRTGTLYIADAGGHRVYSIDPARRIHAIAGNGSTASSSLASSSSATALSTALLTPSSLAVDAALNLYIADPAASRIYTVSGSRISTVDDGSLDISNSPLANPTTEPSPTNQSTPTSTSSLTNTPRLITPATPGKPVALAVDPSGSLFVIDQATQSVREISYAAPSIDFGPVRPNAILSATRVFTNIGTGPLTLHPTLATTDAHFTPNLSSTTCAGALTPGASCVLSYTFAPSAVVPYSASALVAIPAGIPAFTANTAVSTQPSTQALTFSGTGRAVIAPSITFNPETGIYGAPYTGTVTASGSPAPTGTLTFTGPTGQTLCTFTGTLTATTTCTAPSSGLPAGSDSITVSYSGDTNYSPLSGIVTLTLASAPLTINTASAARIYGAPNPSFTGVITGLIGSDNLNLTFASSASATSPVNTYPITASYTAAGSTSLANYAITNNPGTLTVTRAILTVTLSPATRAYGTANPTFTYIGPSGVANNETFVVTTSTSATLASPIATYPITATVTGATSANYNIIVNPGVLTVTQVPASQATPVVTCSAAARPYGAPNPAFSSTATGTLNGDTFTVTCASAATPASLVGAYTIIPSASGIAVQNYAFITLTPGVLTISPAATTLTLTSSAPTATVTNPVTFTASVTDAFTSTVGTPTGIVSFSDGSTVLGTGILTSAGTATFTTSALALGSHTITANYGGTANFAASTGSLAQPVIAGSFTLAASPLSQFIRGPGTTTYVLNLTSVNGFTGPVALTCAGLPADASCTFDSSTVILSANALLPTTVSVVNTVADARLHAPSRFGREPRALLQTLAATVFPCTAGPLGGLALLGVPLLGLLNRRRCPRLALHRLRLLLLLVSLGALSLAGCADVNTTFQTYPITITATSTAGLAPTQTTVVYLSVGLQ